MTSRRAYRVSLVVLVLLSLGMLTGSYLGFQSNTAGALSSQAALPFEERDQLVEPRDDVTVMSTQFTGSKDGALVAFAPDGRLLHYSDRHKNYADVDPIEGTSASVSVVAINESDCGDGLHCDRVLVDRVNLSTGEYERQYTYRRHDVAGGTDIHDADWIDEHRLLVADIGLDRVFVVNTTTGIVEWSWPVRSDYEATSGGAYPTDWTHMNDVEVLPDGRYMVSLRNQDQVAFLNRSGLQPEWTLGSDGDHDTLYEQHNPDYIPAERGGPAVVVADSENERVVEYQRTDGEWERTWTWQDERLAWPRDADRLPSGNTLVTDSNGHRVVEVAPNGSVVWSVDMSLKIYEAERFGTGDESAGGHAATTEDLTNRTVEGVGRSSGDSLQSQIASTVLETLPSPVVNGLFFVLPPWVGTGDMLALAILAGSVPAWIVLEVWWAPFSVRFRRPIEVVRGDGDGERSEP